ncbi:MAG: tRNA pseudouridine(55) synthase TruB [Gammaproteobacteria bacterium]|nr:tRNA pseudouridine(55) synthase TruB [Gammaproteobacteria bacterium]
MNRARERRAVHGIVLLDKPVGITSNAALQRVKRLFNATKAGHTGNLDGPASGLLPVCLGEATKVTPYLLDADKEYVARIAFGIRTTTADAAGEVIETRSVPALDVEAVDRVLRRFQGEIEQVPPMYSALKHQGERLYRLAAQGVTVERKARTVTIHAIERLALGASDLEIRVRCSKGTYIRTLAEDIGGALGTVAHLLALRRTRVAPFGIEDAHALDELERRAAAGMQELDAVLIAMDLALPQLAAVQFSRDSAYYVRTGQAVRTAGAAAGLLRMYDEEGRFMGIGERIEDGRVAPRRLVNRN